jgi:hypothetical protein
MWRKTRPRARGLRKNAIPSQRRPEAPIPLTLLTERPIFGGNRLELFRFGSAGKPSKTAANRDSSLYRWEKFGFSSPDREAPPIPVAIVIPDASHLRNAEHREFYLSGLRLAAGEAT